MALYRKKPVVLAASQWFKDGDHPAVVRHSDTDGYQADWRYVVHTLEGPLNVSPGDWIVTGIKGESYPVKPDIFAELYEPLPSSWTEKPDGEDQPMVNYRSMPNMRELHGHKVNKLNRALFVAALDKPGPSGASQVYVIDEGGDVDGFPTCNLVFHAGPYNEPSDISGISIEAILAVVVDRLTGFQCGSFACQENAMALISIREAVEWLNKRTRERDARGVEGLDKV